MAKTVYTDEQKARALAVYTAEGAGEASRQTGIPRPTITSWARRGGIATEATDARAEAMRRAVDLATLTFAQTRTLLANESMAGAVKLLRRATAEDTDAIDAQRFSSAVTNLASTAQLLAGAATIRTEALGDPEARADRVARLRDELEERRTRRETEPTADTG